MWELPKTVTPISKTLVLPELIKMWFGAREGQFQKSGGCCCAVTQSCPTFCNPVDSSTPGFPVLSHLLELSQTHVDCVGGAILPYYPLTSPPPPAFNLSQIRVFPNESALCMRWPKYSASASVLPMNIHS